MKKTFTDKLITGYYRANATEFKPDLFDELGIQGNPKREILYEIAWDLGHSHGYSEVYGYALDLVPLIK